MNYLAETIPAWLVAISWLYAGFIWMVTRSKEIRMDSRIWAVTFILTGLLYLTSYIPSPIRDHMERVPELKMQLLEFRLYFTRIIMILLSSSMSLPITVSYFRMRNKNGKLGKHNNNSNSRS